MNNAESFLATGGRFSLGTLTTEQAHPHTRNLSRLANDALPAAIECLIQADRQALAALAERLADLVPLAQSIRAVAASGGRLFIGGCGATGRLAIALEVLAREGFAGTHWSSNVIGFMAGGDAALVRAIEGFEDHPEFGARQLDELGFGQGDLFVGVTEGGETPFVIGATLEAARRSTVSPWFLFCNPVAELHQVERSRQILECPGIHSLSLCVGPMALAGSTRMQASTVLMLALGLAMSSDTEAAMRTVLDRLRGSLDALSPAPAAALIQCEADHCAAGGEMIYTTDDWGVTVLTDTTERAPTFSLAPFENTLSDADPPALSYLCLPAHPTVDAAWHTLLHRPPRLLEWPDCAARTGWHWFRGFDISAGAAQRRSLSLPFSICARDAGVRLECGRHSWTLPVAGGASLLETHVLLKMVLNQHSTLVMGRLGRYQGNIMTYVRAANGKLIDRAARYVCALHGDKYGHEAAYPDAVRAVFAALDKLPPDQPVVLRALDLLRPPGNQ